MDVKVGDIVRVTDFDEIYPSYSEFYETHGMDRGMFDMHNNLIKNGDTVAIVAIAKHSLQTDLDVAIITTGTQDYIINCSAIQLLYKIHRGADDRDAKIVDVGGF